MEIGLRNSLLLDFYGNMLTDKQREIFEIYVECDSGLSEIAEQMNMSRQAVYDSVKKTESILLNYEDKLKCVQKFIENKKEIENCVEGLKKLNQTDEVKKIINSLQKVLKNQ